MPHSNLRLKEVPLQADASLPLNQDSTSNRLQFLTNFSTASFVAALLCAVYIFFFWKSIDRFWFNPAWTTDDSLQQVFPFHKVYHPEIFKNDLVTQMMEVYLPPLHYAICYAITWLTADPVMMGHWVMLIQVVLSALFMFLAVRKMAGNIAAYFALAWLFHTRHIMQRLTGGLPRGWAACVFIAYLYFSLSGRHRAILATIMIGCILHPPATFLIAIAYGLLLLWRSFDLRTRQQYIKPLKIYLICSPVFVITTLCVLHTPESIGSMASYEVASKMPEFLKPKGRFPFVPLRDPLDEILTVGFQAFIDRFYNPGHLVKVFMPDLVMLMLAGLVTVGALRKRVVVPAELAFFGLSSLIVYFLSRIFAFKLYVPDRHLQFPLGIFFIMTFSIGFWRAFFSDSRAARDREPDYLDCSFRTNWKSMLALCAVAAIIVLGEGSGLYGAANFNYSIDKRGPIWSWMKQHVPEDAMVAGHPTHIDAIQLFGMRKGFITTETAHPFYDRYYKIAKERLEISFRAHYARNLQEFLEITEKAGIDYFVFNRMQFYPDVMQSATYHAPLDRLLRQLLDRPVSDYAFRQLPARVDLKHYPFMPYRDKLSVVVDIKKLKEYLKNA